MGMLEAEELGTILVVDDEVSALGSVCMLLDESFSVRSATNVADAERVLDAGGVDVVLSDYEMPRASGLVFLAGVERRAPEIVRLLMTANATFPEVIAARRRGRVYHVMAKPLDPDEVVGTVARAVRLAKSRKEL